MRWHTGPACSVRCTSDPAWARHPPPLLVPLLPILQAPALCLLVSNLLNSVALRLSGITLCYTV